MRNPTTMPPIMEMPTVHGLVSIAIMISLLLTRERQADDLSDPLLVTAREDDLANRLMAITLT
jgi:hypothetical protein